jgi:hypothetical protein
VVVVLTGKYAELDAKFHVNGSHIDNVLHISRPISDVILPAHDVLPFMRFTAEPSISGPVTPKQYNNIQSSRRQSNNDQSMFGAIHRERRSTGKLEMDKSVKSKRSVLNGRSAFRRVHDDTKYSLLKQLDASNAAILSSAVGKVAGIEKRKGSFQESLSEAKGLMPLEKPSTVVLKPNNTMPKFTVHNTNALKKPLIGPLRAAGAAAERVETRESRAPRRNGKQIESRRHRDRLPSNVADRTKRVDQLVNLILSPILSSPRPAATPIEHDVIRAPAARRCIAAARSNDAACGSRRQRRSTRRSPRKLRKHGADRLTLGRKFITRGSRRPEAMDDVRRHHRRQSVVWKDDVGALRSRRRRGRKTARRQSAETLWETEDSEKKQRRLVSDVPVIRPLINAPGIVISSDTKRIFALTNDSFGALAPVRWRAEAIPSAAVDRPNAMKADNPKSVASPLSAELTAVKAAIQEPLTSGFASSLTVVKPLPPPSALGIPNEQTTSTAAVNMTKTATAAMATAVTTMTMMTTALPTVKKRNMSATLISAWRPSKKLIPDIEREERESEEEEEEEADLRVPIYIVSMTKRSVVKRRRWDIDDEFLANKSSIALFRNEQPLSRFRRALKSGKPKTQKKPADKKQTIKSNAPKSKSGKVKPKKKGAKPAKEIEKRAGKPMHKMQAANNKKGGGKGKKKADNLKRTNKAGKRKGKNKAVNIKQDGKKEEKGVKKQEANIKKGGKKGKKGAKKKDTNMKKGDKKGKKGAKKKDTNMKKGDKKGKKGPKKQKTNIKKGEKKGKKGAKKKDTNVKKGAEKEKKGDEKKIENSEGKNVSKKTQKGKPEKRGKKGGKNRNGKSKQTGKGDKISKQKQGKQAGKPAKAKNRAKKMKKVKNNKMRGNKDKPAKNENEKVQNEEKTASDTQKDEKDENDEEREKNEENAEAEDNEVEGDKSQGKVDDDDDDDDDDKSDEQEDHNDKSGRTIHQPISGALYVAAPNAEAETTDLVVPHHGYLIHITSTDIYEMVFVGGPTDRRFRSRHRTVTSHRRVRRSATVPLLPTRDWFDNETTSDKRQTIKQESRNATGMTRVVGIKTDDRHLRQALHRLTNRLVAFRSVNGGEPAFRFTLIPGHHDNSTSSQNARNTVTKSAPPPVGNERVSSRRRGEGNRNQWADAIRKCRQSERSALAVDDGGGGGACGVAHTVRSGTSSTFRRSASTAARSIESDASMSLTASWYLQRCQQLQSNDCRNGGMCVVVVIESPNGTHRRPTCICPRPYHGRQCELTDDDVERPPRHERPLAEVAQLADPETPCRDNECFNEGICKVG